MRRLSHVPTLFDLLPGVGDGAAAAVVKIPVLEPFFFDGVTFYAEVLERDGERSERKQFA